MFLSKLSIRVLILALIISGAIGARYNHYRKAGTEALDPDVVTYIILTRQLANPYETYTREPLYMWMLKPVSLISNLDQSVRTVSLIWSIIFLFSALATFGKDMSFIQKAIFMSALAVNNFLIYNSARGLRTEILMTLITLYTYLAIKRGNIILLCILGSALLLLSFNTLLILILLSGYWVWNNKKPLQYLLPLVLVPLIIMSPYFGYNYNRFHDPFYFWNTYGTWYRNYEFLDYYKTGCADCPTIEEYKNNGYGGKPITVTQYFMQYHGPAGVAKKTVRGLVYLYAFAGVGQILTGEFSSYGITFLRIMMAVGFISLLFINPVLVILPAIIANLSAFFIPLNVDPRLWVQTIPFLYVIYSYGIYIVYKKSSLYVRTILQKQKPF